MWTLFDIITNNEEFSISPKCDHHGPPACLYLSHRSPFPTNHDPMMVVKHDINNKDHDGGDMLEVVIHKKFTNPIVDIFIFWLEERISWSILYPFVPSSLVILHAWAFYFSTSHRSDPPYDCSCPCSWICS